MLRTRLWMGGLLIVLAVLVLVVDQRLAPWFPFLFVLVLGLASLATFELCQLLRTAFACGKDGVGNGRTFPNERHVGEHGMPPRQHAGAGDERSREERERDDPTHHT